MCVYAKICNISIVNLKNHYLQTRCTLAYYIILNTENLLKHNARITSDHGIKYT